MAKTNEENKKLQIDIEKALSETGQIEQTINYTKKICLIYGFQVEPTPLEQNNLLKLKSFKKRYPCV